MVNGLPAFNLLELGGRPTVALGPLADVAPVPLANVEVVTLALPAVALVSMCAIPLALRRKIQVSMSFGLESEIFTLTNLGQDGYGHESDQHAHMHTCTLTSVWIQLAPFARRSTYTKHVHVSGGGGHMLISTHC